MFRRAVAFFRVRFHPFQPQPRKSNVNERLLRLRRQPSSPVRLRQIIPKTRAHPVPRSPQATTADVFPVFFENCRPQAVSVRWLAQILLPKTSSCFLHWPSLPSHVPPHLSVRVRVHKIGFVPRLVRPEEQSCGLEKYHRACRMAENSITPAYAHRPKRPLAPQQTIKLGSGHRGRSHCS